ncbi:PKD domain-containing protein [Flavicella marina]|uniref:PKD domain-containing protein n=1 Tax=Flavicella marina TaxID=1475951 RepID=UPI001264E274|nr:gliding motility-associated C-terminal domain-containing protein [Flavicella marina]
MVGGTKNQYKSFKYLKLQLLSILFIVVSFSSTVSAQNCTVNAGIDRTICETETLTLEGVLGGAIDSSLWIQTGGPSVIIENPTNEVTDVIGTLGGNTYTFMLTAVCGDTVDANPQTVTIVVNEIPDAVAGSDIEGCPGSYTLNATPVDASLVDVVGKWTIEGGNNAGVTLTDSSSPTSGITLSNASIGTTTLRWTIENTTTLCSTYDEISVTNFGGEPIAIAGNDKTLSQCYTTSTATNLDGSIGGDGTGSQIGVWSFVSGPNVPNIADENDEKTRVSGLIEGTYVFRWTVHGPCASGRDEVTIIVPAATQDITDARILNGNQRFCDPNITTAILKGEPPTYAGETVEWTQVSGPTLPAGSILSPNSPTTQVINLDGSHNKTYTFEYKIIGGPINPNCSSKDEGKIHFSSPNVSIIVNNGNDMILNQDQTRAVVPFMQSGGNRTRYEIIAAPDPSGLVSLKGAGSSPLTLDLLAGEGTYTLRLVRDASGEVLTDCNVASDQINIVVSLTPTDGNAGSNSVLNCGQTSTTLAGNPISVGTATWSQVSGPNTAIFSDVNIPNPEVTGLIPGEYVFRYLVSGGPNAQDSFSDTYVTYAMPPVADAGLSESICAGTHVLSGNALEAGQTGKWTVTPSDGVSFVDDTVPDAIVSGLKSNQAYTFTWTISTLKCGDDADDVVLTTDSLNSPSIADAGPDQCVASNVSIGVLTAIETESPFRGTGEWTFVSGPATPTILKTGDFTADVSGMTADGDYEFKWTVSTLLCSAQTEDTTTITVAPNAGQNLDAGPDQTICGDQVVMAANVPATGLVGKWEQTSGNAGWTVDNINSPTAIFTNLLDGNYAFNWVVSKGTCESASDEMKFSISTGPTTATAGPISDICNGSTAVLTGNVITEGVGTWSVVAGPNNPNIADIHDPVSAVSNLVSGEYTFKWTSSNGINCPNSEATTTFIVAAEINLDGKDQDLCAASQVLLEANPGAMGVWTQTAPINTAVISITTTSDQTAIVELDPTISDTYVFTFTANSSSVSCTSSDELEIKNTKLPDAPNAGPDQSICTDTNTSVTMAAIGEPGEWILVTGPNTPTISSSTDKAAVISNLVEGLYVYEWNVGSLPCTELKDVVRINVYDPPLGADAGPDQTGGTAACQVLPQLDAATPTNGIGTWTLTTDPSLGTGIIIDSPNDPKSTLTINDPFNLPIGNYVFTWTVSNGNPVCSDISDQVILEFTAPPASDANAGSDQELCDVTSSTLFGNSISFGSGQWTQDSGPNTAVIANQFNSETAVSGMIAGTYVFRWTITSGGCNTTDTVEIIIYDDTAVGVLDAGPDQIVPQFDNIFMDANDVSPAVGEWQFKSGPSTPIIIDKNDPKTQITGVVPGVYEFNWTVRLGICPQKEDAVLITVVGVTDVGVDKNVDIPSPVVGSTVSYSVTLTNHGINTATGVEIKDLLPSGVSLVSGSVDNGGVYNSGGNSIIWSNLMIAPGKQLVLNYKAVVNNPNGGADEYKNTASLEKVNEIDADPTNDSDSVTLTPSVIADVVLSKEVSNANPNEGDIIFYTIKVTNNSISEITNVVITDNLPAGLTYISGIGTVSVWTPPTWNIGTMLPGATEELILEVQVDAGTSGQTLTNVISNTQDQVDQNITLDDDTATIVVASSDLVTTKTVNKPLVVEGETIWYTLKVANNGPDLATNVSLVDVLPAGVIYVSDNSGGTYNSGNGLWTIGDIENGKSAEIKIFVKIDSGTQGQKIVNTTTAATGDQADPTTNGDDLEAEVVVDSETDVVITKTVDNPTPNEGDIVTYTIRAENKGVVNITNIVVTDMLPAGLTHITGNPSEGTWIEPNWSMAQIVPGGTEELTLQVHVESGTAGKTLTNTVSNTQDQYDSNVTPDDMEETVVVTSSDLVTVKTVSDNAPSEGDEITYTIEVTNNGGSDATGIGLVDNLPSGVTYVSDDSGGDYNSGSGIWIIGNLANGNSTSLNIKATVNASTAGSVVTNTTTAAVGDQTDPTDTGDVLSADIHIDNATDIVLSKKVNNSLPNEGDAIIYTIEVTNNGIIDATNLVITDVLDPGLVYVSGVATEGVWNFPTWTLTTLGAGVTETLLVQVVVATGTSGQTLTNTISNTQDQLDNNATPDDDNESVVVSAVDLVTVKTVNNDTPQEGDIVTYSLVVTNNGPNAATNVTVIDKLPNGVTYISDDRSGFYDPATGVWYIGYLANGSTANINIHASVDNGTAGSSVENIATAAIGDQTDTSTVGDVLNAIIYVDNETDIVLSKVVDNANPNGGDKINYTIVVENKGPIEATNIVITDVLPSGLTLLSSIPSSGVYSNSEWKMSALSVGEQETLILEVLVSDTADGMVLTNTISNTQDQFDNNNTADDLDESILVASADLVTQKVVDNATPKVGDEINYTITVRNIGPDNATNVSLIDHLPVGVTYVSDDASGAYDPVTGIWTLPVVNNGVTEALNIKATVDAGTGGTTITNTTTAAKGDQTKDSPIGDNLEAVIYVDNETDIAVTKIVNNQTPSEGSTVIFTIEVTNNGPIEATNLKLTDVIPRDLTLVSGVPNQGVWNSPVWNIGSLANGASATLILNAKVNAGTAGNIITNYVYNTQDQLDTDATPDDLSESLTVASSNLVTVKTVDNNTPSEGETIHYTIKVENNGPVDATNVSLVDLLPNEVTYVSDDAGGDYNAGSGIWTIGAIPNGGSAQLEIEATINSSTAGSTIINRTSAAVSDQTDPDTTGDMLEASVFVDNETDIVLSKVVNNNSPNEGETIRYSISVTNNGPITATNVKITDVLPNGLTYVSGIPSKGIWNDPIWSINTLASGETLVLIVDAIVDSGTAGQNLTNTISNTQDQLDTNNTLDDLEETVIVGASDLVTIKTVDNPAPDEGDTIVYTITVTNNGLNDATSVSLIDHLPFGVTYVSDDGLGTYSNATKIWSIGDLAFGDTASLNIVATVNAGTAGTSIVNTTTAAIGDQADPSTAGDVLFAQIFVENKTDIVLTKVANNLTPNEGDEIFYTIRVSNEGTIQATNLIVEDLLPVGLTYLSGTPTTGVWNNPQWHLNSLSAGETETLLLRARVDTGTAGQSIINTISNTQDQLDTNATADDLEETIVVTASDLITVKSVDVSTPDEGDTVIYTIEVSNNGPSNATGVYVVDHLPNGVSHVSDDSSGAFDPISGVWSIGSLPFGSSAILNITTIVDAGTAGKTITNQTTRALADQADTSFIGDVLEASIYIDNETDIYLTKVANNQTPNEGDTVIYTIEVENKGVIDATNVRIRDVLPAGLTYVSAIPTTGNWNAQTWSINKLAAGSSERLFVTVTVDAGTAGQILTNTVSNTQDQFDSDITQDDLQETIVVTATDLITVKSVDITTPSEAQTITYSITVTNNGTSDATGVSLVDVLPNGVSYDSDNGGGKYNNATGLWDIGALANGATTTLLIQGVIDAGSAGSTIVNTTSAATADQADPTTNGDVLSATVYVENETDIVLSKTVNNSTPNEGEDLFYTIIVENKGGISATNLKITDVLPAGLSYVSGTPTAGSWNSPIWSINTLAPGAIEYLTLKVNVDPGTAGQILTNTISNAQDQLDTNISPDDLDETVVVASADLVTVKTVNNTTPDEGEVITYTIQVTNNGGSDATNVSLIDHLPQGVVYQSDDSGGSYNFGSGVWSIGSLANGVSVSLNIDALVSNGTAGKTITNTTTAAVGDQTDLTTNGDQLEATIHIDNETDIVLEKTVNNNTPDEGDSILYSVKVTNNGSIRATNVVVTDMLPTGLIYVAGTTTSGTWAYPNWSLNSIEVGATETLLLQVNVGSGTAGQILTNTISNTQDQLDTNTTPDDAEESIVVSSTDIVTVKSVDNTTPDENDTIVYTITVTNNGANDATGVSLVDNLPNGVTYSSDNGGGAYNVGSGVWTIGDLLNGASKTLTISAVVDASTAGSTIVNKTTAASGDQADPSSVGDVLEASIYVDNETDIVLSKEVNNATPNEGDHIIYTIRVTNNGTIDATNVVVTDMLPAGLSYVSGVPTEGIWTAPNWYVGNLNAGDTYTLLLRVLVDPGASGKMYTNTISNTQDQLDNNNTPDDTEATIIVSAADLRVSKIVDNSSPVELSTINYTISVTNDGPNNATNVSITDNLPADLRYLSDDSSGMYNSGSGVWSIGNLANGETKTLNIEAIVRVGTVGNVIVNTTSNLTADQHDLNTTNNIGSVTVIPVRDVDLSLTKTFIDGTDIAAIGNQKTFELRVTNEGKSLATGVEVTDLLPSGYKFLKYNSTTGTYDYNTGIWNVGEVLPSSTVILTIDVLVLGTGDHENCAEITAMNETDLDSTPGNGNPSEDDYACVGISYISSLNLGVEKSVVNNKLTPNVGDEITFKIQVTNYGQLDATTVQLSEVLPTGFNYVAYKATAGIYDSGTGVWTINTLAKTSIEILTITATVNALGDYENCVTIIGSSNTDSDASDNTSCVLVAPVSLVDLELKKEVSDNKPLAGEEIEFLVRLINRGPSEATGVEVEDILPSGYVYVSSSATLGSYDDASGIWDVGTLQVGVEEDLTIVVKVKSTGDWDNTAQVEACNEQDIDSIPGNDNPDEDDQDTVEVDVKVGFFIPEEFTPNGDGLNDTFEITNLSVLYPDFKIVIVNRWGNKVFAYKHNGDPNSTAKWWDGYSDGGVNLGSGDVPDGTYFYTIEFNNNDRAPQTGWVYLRR